MLVTKIVGHATLCPTYAEAALIGASALTATADFKLLLAGSISLFFSFPFRGKAGMGVEVALYASAPPLKPTPTLTLWRNY
jgi:hypothetical protein